MLKVNNKWDYALHITPEKMRLFWGDRLKEKREILLITGLGWDPRMTAFANVLKNYGGAGIRDIHIINYKPSSSFKSPYQNLIDINTKIVDSLTNNWGEKTIVNITTRSNESMYIGDKEIEKYSMDIDLSKYSEIIVDLSSLPKSLYFTLLYVLIKKSEKFFNNKKNIYAIVCQNSELDSQIFESVDDTRFLKGFRGKTGRLGKNHIPKIWVPILAKNHPASLRKIREVADPRDTYPILPFPSRNPREDDDLLIEYSKIFSDEWSLNILNFIYAAEDDPLDVYQSILKLFSKQKETLAPLGGCTFIISALSSKLSSLGAFMAAFEKDMAIAHAIGRHNPPDKMDDKFLDINQMTDFKNNLHTIWLAGEPYGHK